jgi:hypothetical protein
MKLKNALWVVLLWPSMGKACDVCGIFLGIQPHDRASNISLLYRYRRLEGTLPAIPPVAMPTKHGGHANTALVPQATEHHYRELYQTLELRADLWLSQRWAVLVSLPVVNNYQALDGYVAADIYGVGDPLLLGRYLVANTRCTTTEERTVHRLSLGGGAKVPLGQHGLRYRDAEAPHDLQPGTGTWDLLASAEYRMRHGRNGASLTAIGRRNGTDADGMRMGHGLSATAECFRRFDIGDDWRIMPSLGAYHELTGKDAMQGEAAAGTGSSTLFTHASVRVWWRSWGIQGTFQFAVARRLGKQMVPNRERAIIGLTYNITNN